MPYTRITATANGREAIEYARGNGQGHNGNEHRNLLIDSVGMVDESIMSYEEQMDLDWKRASRKNKNQVRRIIASWGKDELNPEDPNSIEKARLTCREFVQERYPNRKTLIFIQKDGKGGCLHAHMIISNVDSVDFKGCTDEQTKYWYVEKYFDEISEKYIPTKQKEPTKEKFTQNERRIKDHNEEVREQNPYATDTELRKQGLLKYSWKEDLKERIRKAMSESTSRDDYLKKLTAYGVEGTYKSSRKQGEFILYELTDITGFQGEKVPDNLKSKSYKIGTDFGLEKLDETIKYNTRYNQVQAQAQAPVTSTTSNIKVNHKPIDINEILAEFDRTHGIQEPQTPKEQTRNTRRKGPETPTITTEELIKALNADDSEKQNEHIPERNTQNQSRQRFSGRKEPEKTTIEDITGYESTPKIKKPEEKKPEEKKIPQERKVVKQNKAYEEMMKKVRLDMIQAEFSFLKQDEDEDTGPKGPGE